MLFNIVDVVLITLVHSGKQLFTSGNPFSCSVVKSYQDSHFDQRIGQKVRMETSKMFC